MTSAPWSTVEPAALDLPTDPSGARRVHSEPGARRAALDYLVTVRQRVVYLSAEAAETVVRDWAAAGVGEAVISGDVTAAAQLRHSLTANGGQVWWVVAPLSVRVDAYSSRAGPGVGVDGQRRRLRRRRRRRRGGDPDGPLPDRDRRVGVGRGAVVGVGGHLASTVRRRCSPPAKPRPSPAEFVTVLEGFSLVKEHN